MKGVKVKSLKETNTQVEYVRVCVHVSAACRSAEWGYANFPWGRRLVDSLRCWLCLQWTTHVVPSANRFAAVCWAQVQDQLCDSFDSLSLSHLDHQPAQLLDVTARKNTPTSCRLQNPPQSADGEDSPSRLTVKTHWVSSPKLHPLGPVDDRLTWLLTIDLFLTTNSLGTSDSLGDDRLTWLLFIDSLLKTDSIGSC